MANGSSDKTVKYWDLEQFTNVSISALHSSPITNLCFDENNAEVLFASSGEHVKCWNIENNKLLDVITSVPRGGTTDLKIAAAENMLMMSTISNNTVSVFTCPLESINYDESVDVIPTQEYPARDHQFIDEPKPKQNLVKPQKVPKPTTEP